MLLRRKPFGYLQKFGYFDDDFTAGLRKWAGDPSMPAVNVSEKGDAYQIEVAIPGLKKEDFNVGVKDNVLTVAAEVKAENCAEDEADHCLCREFSFTSFKRSFSLPESGIDRDGVKASYQDGILSVSLPKVKTIEQDEPKMITVH